MLQKQCDPVSLLEAIRWSQAALVNGESEPSSETDQSASSQELNAFLGSLRTLERRMGIRQINRAAYVVDTIHPLPAMPKPNPLG